MLAMPFIGAAVGTVNGIAFLDNWKARGFWGIMVGKAIFHCRAAGFLFETLMDIRQAIQIVQLVLETGAAGCVGFLAGAAFITEHTALVARYGEDTLARLYWPTVRRCFWLCQYLGSCLLAWLFLEGGAYVDMIAAVVGLIVGIGTGIVRKPTPALIRGALPFGLVLCGFDYICELVANRFSGRLIASLFPGVAIAAAAGVVFVCLWGLTKAFRKESRIWSFRVPAFASLLLTSGGLFLWLVLACSVAFGFSCSSRYVPPASEFSWQRTVCLGIASLAVGHGLFHFYFYEMSSYGIFSHPVIAVAPYSLGGALIGFFSHRVGFASVMNDRNAA